MRRAARTTPDVALDLAADLGAELRAIVGPRHCLTADDARQPFETDHRGLYHGRAAAVVRPGDREELQAVVRHCAELGVAMVPQGGNTGYCGGATPDASGHQVVIATTRLARLIDVDSVNATLTVEAGVTLADAQRAAEQHGLLLPLSMGSEGSCQIGGNLATNAGGLAVLRYGNARELCLGLEAVTADGARFSDLAGLRKDNTGYDLSGLMIGAEGTLGIITAATLRLFPRPRANHTVFAAVGGLRQATTLLRALQAQLGDTVTSFEYLAGDAVRLSLDSSGASHPLGAPAPHCVLFEWSEFGSASRRPEDVLGALPDGTLIEDAVVARSETQRRGLWSLREQVPAAERLAGGSVKHDISVRIGLLEQFVERARALLAAGWPRARTSVYGHIGDGNVHFNVLAPAADEPTSFVRAHGDAISAGLHALAHECGGSFSAEHGVGMLKRDLLQRYADPHRLACMRALKLALDPRGLMNPGKVI